MDWVTIANNTATAPYYYPFWFGWSGGPDVSLHCGPGTNCWAQNSVVVDGCYGVSAVTASVNLEDNVGKTAASCGAFSIYGSFLPTGWASSSAGNETMAAFFDASSDAWQAGGLVASGQEDQTGLSRGGTGSQADLGAFELSP
jgi:hypothetical protein